MKQILCGCAVLVAGQLAMAQPKSGQSGAVEQVTIPIGTSEHVILLQTDRDNRLGMVYLGQPLGDAGAYENVAREYHFFDSNAGTYN
jgi:hypothetical protein